MKAFLLALKGAAMGMAEVVPGVSGGTIAFITGIYEELIHTIKSLTGPNIRLLFRGKFQDFWMAINGSFLLYLLGGMLGGIIFGVFVITALLEHYPEILWGFFFGLIFASAIYIFRQIPQRKAVHIFLILGAAILTYFLTESTPVEGSRNLLYVFLCGVIAISALVLPGISGSFILLLLGMYVIVIPEIKELIVNYNMESALLIGVFGLGCALGLGFFTRVLSFLLKHYLASTFAIMTGFMLGSLNKIWPWREPTAWMTEEGRILKDITAYNQGQDLKILNEVKVSPLNYSEDPHLWLTIASCILGLVLVYSLGQDKLGKKVKKRTP